MKRTTTQAVVATLRAAGFVASRRTRRESRSGYTVRKYGAQVGVFWNDVERKGDGAAQFAAVRAALAGGFHEVYVNERAQAMRVLGA